jgi:penicillin-binding protein 1C
LAPHAARRTLRAHPQRPVHRLTIDGGLQARLQELTAERARSLGQQISVALLVVDHRTGEVLASIGSADLLDTRRQGFVDMTRAVRSPGSTLKPLIYGLAFELGLAHPESLIEDRPTGFAGYVPSNFDREFQGTVTVRRALQLSLNVPAVRLLDAVGSAHLLLRMRRARAAPVLSDWSPPGLAIGLGGIGVRLTGLVGLYAAIARGGRPIVLKENLDAPHQAPPRQWVLGQRAAWYLSSILAGTPGPNGIAPEGLAFKTGTSYGHRDAWAVGFDGRHVVGVWVGRADGAPVPALTGIAAAAPILIDAFARVGPRAPLAAPPPGVLSAGSADLPPPLRRVGGQGGKAPKIAFPPQGARLSLEADAAAELVLKVRNGTPPFVWFADGAPIARERYLRTARWVPQGPGFARISVVDGGGRTSAVQVFLEPRP